MVVGVPGVQGAIRDVWGQMRGRGAAGVYKGCGKCIRGRGAVWVQAHGARQSFIRALCCLLLHLVMKTEISSGFE